MKHHLGEIEDCPACMAEADPAQDLSVRGALKAIAHICAQIDEADRRGDKSVQLNMAVIRGMRVRAESALRVYFCGYGQCPGHSHFSDSCERNTVKPAKPPWTLQQKVCLGFCISGIVMLLIVVGYAVWIW